MKYFYNNEEKEMCLGEVWAIYNEYKFRCFVDDVKERIYDWNDCRDAEEQFPDNLSIDNFREIYDDFADRLSDNDTRYDIWWDIAYSAFADFCYDLKSRKKNNKLGIE